LIEASQSLFSDLQPDYKQFHEAGISGVESYFKQLSEKYHDNIDVRSKLIDLAFSYAYSDKLESATKVMEKVISENADNLLYRIRLAQIQVRAEDKTNALSTLKTALKLAEQKNDEEAISFIKRLTEDASGES